MHILGKELKIETEILLQKLNTRLMFEEWCVKVMGKTKPTNNRLFLVEKQQRDGKSICRLNVNYAPEAVVIFKEVLKK